MNNGWIKLHRPIRCFSCKKYCERMLQVRMGEEEFCFCFFPSKEKCWKEFQRKWEFYDKNVLVIGLEFPPNSQESRKQERNVMSYKLRWEILKRDDFKCVICGTNDRLEIDHIIAVSQGGKTTTSNLQTLCFPCNRGKYDE